MTKQTWKSGAKLSKLQTRCPKLQAKNQEIKTWITSKIPKSPKIQNIPNLIPWTSYKARVKNYSIRVNYRTGEFLNRISSQVRMHRILATKNQELLQKVSCSVAARLTLELKETSQDQATCSKMVKLKVRKLRLMLRHPMGTRPGRIVLVIHKRWAKLRTRIMCRWKNRV